MTSGKSVTWVSPLSCGWRVLASRALAMIQGDAARDLPPNPKCEQVCRETSVTWLPSVVICAHSDMHAGFFLIFSPLPLPLHVSRGVGGAFWVLSRLLFFTLRYDIPSVLTVLPDGFSQNEHTCANSTETKKQTTSRSPRPLMSPTPHRGGHS